MARQDEISVFIDPVSRHFVRNELFNPASPHNLDDNLAAYLLLKQVLESQGVEVNTADYLFDGLKRNRTNLYFSFGILRNYRQLAARDDIILSSFFTVEAPIVQPSAYYALPEVSRYFRRIYSYTTPQALTRYGCADLTFAKFHIPYPYERRFDDLWANEDRSFLCMVNYNRLCRRRLHELYTERLRALEYFSQFDEVDLYGLGWDLPPYVVGETWIPGTLTRLHRYIRQNLPGVQRHPYQHVVENVWRGVATEKYRTQSRYTFTICYENMELDGWLNENIFDCFLVGTIPIYLGPPDVYDYIPEGAFIDKRKYATYDELRAYLHSLGPREIRRYKENARDFLSSDRFTPFTKESFVQLFTRAIKEDTGVELRHRMEPLVPA